jgi:formylglycine-generating enzyme required for sulfatase activity
MATTLAIATTEVTVEQFRAFRAEHAVDHDTAPEPDCPVNKVSWYDAAAYCNWLSQKEGIPPTQWCYRRQADGQLVVVPDYLRRTGYRLPTEAEWEFACRAGSRTPWSFGLADEDLVGNYAWWVRNAFANGMNRTMPVATLKPNDFGLFDMHGNVWEWCQEAAQRPADVPATTDLSACRGGCYFSAYQMLRADQRSTPMRSVALNHLGFRLARTLYR